MGGIVLGGANGDIPDRMGITGHGLNALFVVSDDHMSVNVAIG